MIVAVAVQSFLILLFIILGALFLNGKGDILIAGFNTKSKDEQEQYDKIALCKFIGKMNLALAFSMVFGVLSELYQIQFLFIISMALFSV